MVRCPEEHKIVVRGLPSGIDKSEVEDYFNRIGRVADLWLKDTGRDTFGFVGFEARADFEEALRRDGQELNGHVLQIQPKGLPRGAGAAPRDRRDANKIYVQGVGSAHDDDIRSYFEKIGPVTDYFRREGADFCFVGFENAGDHARALKMSGEEISGNRITIEQKGGRGGGAVAGGARSHRGDDRGGMDRGRRRRSSTPPRRRHHDSRSPSRRRSPPRRNRDSRSPPRRRRDSRSPPRHHSRSPKRSRRSHS